MQYHIARQPENQKAIDLAVCHFIAASLPDVWGAASIVEDESPFWCHPTVDWRLFSNKNGEFPLRLSISRLDCEQVEWQVCISDEEGEIYIQPILDPLDIGAIKDAITVVFTEGLFARS